MLMACWLFWRLVWFFYVWWRHCSVLNTPSRAHYPYYPGRISPQGSHKSFRRASKCDSSCSTAVVESFRVSACHAAYEACSAWSTDVRKTAGCLPRRTHCSLPFVRILPTSIMICYRCAQVESFVINLNVSRFYSHSWPATTSSSTT